MTVETKADPSRKTATKNWAPKARRQGEHARPSETAQERSEELLFPPISPPPLWPRVFPGI